MTRPASVTVVIDDDTGKVAVRLVSNPKSGGIPVIQDHVLQFNNNQNNQYSDGFELSFHLPENEGQNDDWVFDDPPIWVKLLDQHGACPRTAGDHNPNILTNPTVAPGGRTLTVTNSNSTRQYFGFTLRFRHTKNNRSLEFDPVGDNQNGGQPFIASNWLVYTGIALGAGVTSAIATTLAFMAFHVI